MSTPARLNKIPEKDTGMEVLLSNPLIVKFCLIILIMVLMVLCLALTYAVFGTPVESGNYYNHLKDVI